MKEASSNFHAGSPGQYGSAPPVAKPAGLEFGAIEAFEEDSNMHATGLKIKQCVRAPNPTGADHGRNIRNLAA